MDLVQIDFNSPKHIYFIGIGGVSMSALARILMDRGFKISGSDIKRGELTTQLEQLGACINYTQDYDNIDKDIDYVVYTAAISLDNPEYKRAVDLKLPMMTRAKLLADIMKNYKHSIAVSGTHGKTSTTSMLSYILMEADKEPTISLGGMLDLINGNLHIGKEELFLTEACEYTNSFLELCPNVEVVLNVDADHLDFFKDIEDIRDSFKKFIAKLDKDSILVINSDIDRLDELIKDCEARIFKFGFTGADIEAKNISFDELGKSGFDLYINSGFIEHIELSVCGMHNILNALAAISVAVALDIDFNSIKKALFDYKGVQRRFELKGKLKGLTIIDDYAHHPSEIEATIKAARNLEHNRLCIVFQPHTYTRTKLLLKEFADALKEADIVVLADIYAAREKDNLGIHSRDIVNLINKDSDKAYYFPDFDEIESFILSELAPGDICITMGAGDIVKLAEQLLGI